MPEILWGPVDVLNWKQVPAVSGRPATEADVKAGRAVFFVRSAGQPTPATPTPTLPRCALFRPVAHGPGIPVVAIQIEQGDDGLVVGYRPLTGGNGVCAIEEIEFLDGPDASFRPQEPS